MSHQDCLELSVIIPARDEAQNLPRLIAEIEQALSERQHEIIVVDDGSTDGTQRLAEELAARHPNARFLRNQFSMGRSGAVWRGVEAARAEIVVQLDGDGQNDPQFLPALAEPLFDDGALGLVAGQRDRHAHGLLKSISSKVANGVRSYILRDGTRDAACGLKAYRRSAYLALPYFGTMHRFLPALFVCDGWKIAHIDVTDRPRWHGVSKYGILDRLAVGLPDLFGVWWLVRRRRDGPFSRSFDRHEASNTLAIHSTANKE